ncbi:MAG: acyl carrier protein [Synergistaceae bacterium]|nr:acyl carrier protein [Synergistaceae bacterium]
MNEDIFRRIVKCIRASSESISDDAAVTPDTILSEDLEMNSLDKVRLQVELEQEFAFNFDPLDDFEAIFQTAGSLYNYIVSKEN